MLTLADIKNQTRQYGLFILVGVLLAGGSPLGYAQETAANPLKDAPASPNGLEEIVVTAQRRAEAIKDVPISITALPAVTLENFGVEDFTDYARLIPNLSFGYGGETGAFSGGVSEARNVTIRGISGAYTTSFYIDDTPLPLSLDPRVLDIDRVEVLRGPQGTLFGASSMGGTIRMITKQPRNDEVYGGIDAQVYGVNHGGAGYSISGNINIPMVPDALSGRFAGFDTFTPGFLTRTSDDPLALNVTGQPVTGPSKIYSNIGAVRESGLGGTLSITPPAVEGLTIAPMVMWQRTFSNGLPLTDYSTSNLVQRRILDQPEAYKDEFFFAAVTGSYQLPFGRVVSSTSWFARESYDQEDGSDANAQTLSPNIILPATAFGTIYNKTFTQEGRFESDFQGPLQLVTGLFYQYVNTIFTQLINTPGLNAAEGGIYGTDIAYSPYSPGVTSQWAAFIGFTYDVTDRLQVAIGGRESILRNNVELTAGGIYGTYGATDAENSNGRAFTPRFAAKYKLTPDTTIYATAAQGFRIGGANAALSSFCAPYGLPVGAEIPYKSDSLWSYEAGIKTSILDDRVSINSALYHIDWSGIQQTQYFAEGQCFANLIENTGTATSDGGEFELTTRIIDGLTAHIAAGYEEAKLTAATAGTAFHIGEPLSGVPKWTAAASLDYTVKMDWGDLFARGEYSFTGKSVSYIESPAGLPRKSYALTDVRFGADMKPFTITLFVKNLFDARPNLGDESPETAVAYGPRGGRYRYIVGQPRTGGLEIRYDF